MFKLRQRTIIETLLVISCIALIIYFMPRDTKFNYYFSLNTPWGYGQLMSDFDFPIYKSQEMIKTEHDSLRKSFQPYFDMDSQITVQALEQFKDDYNSKFHSLITQQQYNTYRRRLQNAYNKGIVSLANAEKMKKDSLHNIKIISDNVAFSIDINKLNTIW